MTTGVGGFTARAGTARTGVRLLRAASCATGAGRCRPRSVAQACHQHEARLEEAGGGNPTNGRRDHGGEKPFGGRLAQEYG